MNSHVIPELLYVPLYDEKHRLLSVKDDTPGSRFLQKGIRESLLCSDCEGFLNKHYEHPFSLWWTEAFLREGISTSPPVRVRGISYAQFKLFHLSIFWRAAVASSRGFRKFDLAPKDRERFREKILTGTPGPATEDQLAGSFVFLPDPRDIVRVIMPPLQSTRRGVDVLSAVYGSAAWLLTVGKHPFPELSPNALAEDGTMTFSVQPLTALNVVDRFFRDNAGVTQESRRSRQG